jgi:RNA polymerase sigma factor (sigma-70 family)
VVERIQAGDPGGLEELHAMIRDGFYGHIWRQLGPQDLEDRIQDVYLIVSECIKRGEVREPERLPGFLATVVRRVIAQQIEKRVNTQRRTVDVPQLDWLADGQPNQETSLAKREEVEVVRRVLGGLKPWEREILDRFYLQEQSAAEIQAGMGLSGTQFRVDKSRAKARFTQLGRAMLGAVGAS